MLYAWDFNGDGLDTVRTLTQRLRPCIPTRWLRPRRCQSLGTAGPSYQTRSRSRPCAAHNRQHFAKGGRRITCLRPPEVRNNTTEINRVDQPERSFVRQDLLFPSGSWPKAKAVVAGPIGTFRTMQRSELEHSTGNGQPFARNADRENSGHLFEIHRIDRHLPRRFRELGGRVL